MLRKYEQKLYFRIYFLNFIKKYTKSTFKYYLFCEAGEKYEKQTVKNSQSALIYTDV